MGVFYQVANRPTDKTEDSSKRSYLQRILFNKQQRGKKQLFSNTSCVLLYTNSCVIVLTCDITLHNKCRSAVSQQTVLNVCEHVKKPKEMGKSRNQYISIYTRVYNILV